MKNNRFFKKNELIRYKWVYSNEEELIGLVVKQEKDANFGQILHILNDKNSVEVIPLRMIVIERIKNEYKKNNIS
jgi:hypothetical protein